MKNVIDVTDKGAMSRRGFIGFASVAALSAVVLSGCSSQESAAPEATLMKIGTMQTEDSLPFWVAEQKGFYGDHDVEVEIVTFQSAQELSTAFAAGEIDGAMTDIMVSASLVASGIGLNLAWITLGATPEQGRFGIQTSPESGIKSLADLKGKGIGVGSNTVPEYVMDKLMEAAGASGGEIVNEEIKKLPVRYESMMNNQVAAAALPGSLLALGEATGMITLADDTQGVGNVSQFSPCVLRGSRAAKLRSRAYASHGTMPWPRLRPTPRDSAICSWKRRTYPVLWPTRIPFLLIPKPSFPRKTWSTLFSIG